MTGPTAELSAGEWAALALVVEKPTHGFAIAGALAPGGDVGRVWSLSRPLVYRALAKLEEASLIEVTRVEAGAGPQRRVLAPTRQGKRRFEAWLEQPVEHVRDVRTLFMLKLLFLARAGRSSVGLVDKQRSVIEPIARSLAAQAASASGFERTLLLWRQASADAVLAFLDAQDAGNP